MASWDGGRLPEIYGGLDADDVAAVVPYPTACSPQAWSASAPLLLLRTALGLDPDIPAGRVRIRPAKHRGTPRTVEGVDLAGHEITVSLAGGEVRLASEGVPTPWVLETG